MSFSLKKMREFSNYNVSTCPHPQILPWLHNDLQRLKIPSITLTIAFSEQMYQVANTGLPEWLDVRTPHSSSCLPAASGALSATEMITPVRVQPGSWLVGCAQHPPRSWPMTTHLCAWPFVLARWSRRTNRCHPAECLQ